MPDNNVLFLVLDSLRKDRTSVYNEKVDFTPTLDNLAENAKVFENAVAQAPWTLPSHASMFTGEYPWEHGINQSKTYFTGEEKTFIQQFNEEGYRTAAITSNVWISPHKGATRDFDYTENFLGKAENHLTVKVSRLLTKIFDSLDPDLKKKAERYLDSIFKHLDIDDSCKSEETVEEVQKYLSGIDNDENFFMYVNLMEPHEPYHPPEEYMEKHGVKDKSKVPQRQKELFTKEIDFEELRKIYDASVDYTDDLVAKIIDSLEENGFRENTVLVIISDHGQALGEDGIFGHQFTIDDSVIDTVAMVDRPGKEGRNQNELLELRKLNGLVPFYAGIGEEPDEIFTEKVRGAYDYPEVAYVPQEKLNEFYKKYRYIKTSEIKTVKETTRDGKEKIRSIDLETGEETETPEEIRKELGEITQVAEKVENKDDRPETEDEEIKRRLEDLGYT